MRTYKVFFLDSFTVVQYNLRQKSLCTFNKKGRMKYILGWVPDEQAAEDYIFSHFPCVSKIYCFRHYRDSESRRKAFNSVLTPALLTKLNYQ